MASNPIGGMGIQWFFLGFNYLSDEIAQNIVYIGQIEENIGVNGQAKNIGQYREYRRTGSFDIT